MPLERYADAPPLVIAIRTLTAPLLSSQAVERSLQPFVGSITLPPSLIATITESDIDDKFIAAVYDLDARLGAIRGGARVESRRSLDDAAEGLRLTVSVSRVPSHSVSSGERLTNLAP